MKYYLKRKCFLEIESGGNGAQGLAAIAVLLRLREMSALSTLCGHSQQEDRISPVLCSVSF